MPYYFTHKSVYCFLLLMAHSVFGDFYSATSELNSLILTHSRLNKEITNYIDHEREKLKILEHYQTLLNKDQAKMLENINGYLDNPLNAFTLIKRLTMDLEFIESKIANSPVFKRKKRKYPVRDDLTGAVEGLERLRSTYLLNITEMANGILKGAKSEPLSIYDCLGLASILYQNNNYNGSLEWLSQALLKYSLGESTYPYELQVILSGLARSYEGLHDETNTQLWSSRISKMHTRYQLQSYKKMAEVLIKSSPRLPPAQTYFPEKDPLCRGDIAVSKEVQKKLKCFYITRNNPFLKLAPFKLEQLYIDPDINMVHDVMNDKEIQHFIIEASPRMERTTIYPTHTSSGAEYSQRRIAKNTWFRPSYSDIMDRVSKRMADFSGLDLGSAEYLQVANYGIGGHYGPHIDFFTNPNIITDKHLGNRYATILIYLSDVASGGRTVFLKLGLSVAAKKGSAIFWRNLLPTGEGNNQTFHAACPVLVGNRWVLNRWLRETGQEFTSLCTDNQKKSEV